jgi:EmrB/QacA subfamily drug resistance transporter
VTATPEPAPSRPTSTTRAHLVVALVIVATTLTGVGISIMSVAYPVIVEAFPDSDPADLSWITNAFTIVGAATLIPAGVLADRWGRRQMVLGGVAVFTGGSIVGALAGSPWLLVVARVIQSLGASAFIPASAALLMAAFPPHRTAAAVGVWAAAGGVSSAVGPALGGLVIDQGGWQWAFWINVPAGLLILAIGPFVFPRTARGASRALPDPLGVLLIVVGVSLLTFGVVKSGEWGWLSSRTLGSIAAGAVVLAVLLSRSARHPNPVLDLELLRRPMVRVGDLGTVLFAACWFSVYFGLVLFVIGAWGWTALRAGVATAPVPLLAGAMGIATGRVAHRTGHRVFIVPGIVAYGASAVWLWATIRDDADLWGALMPGCVLLGLASGLVFPSFIAVSVHGVDGSRHAIATGMNFTAQRIGTTLGVALSVAILSGSGGPDAAGMHRIAALAVVGSFAVLAVASRVDTRPDVAATSRA